MGLKNILGQAAKVAGQAAKIGFYDARAAAPGAAGRSAKTAYGVGQTLIGMGRTAAAHPWTTTAAVVGIGTIASYGGTQQASIPAGTPTRMSRPGTAAGDYNLGGEGDLVFALHRNR